MPKKNVLVIGSGQRVQNTILPAIYCLQDEFELLAVYSRSIKDISLFNRKMQIQTINDFSRIDFRSLDLIMVAVTLEQVPDVLKKLAVYNTQHVRLLIDTPVLSLHDIRCARYFKKFRSVGVSEDSITLPPFVLARKLIDQGQIGKIKEISLIHSGYRYHALATLKMLTGVNYISKIKNTYSHGKIAERQIIFRNGIKASIVEPRDYSVGKFHIIGEGGAIADYDLSGPNLSRLDYKVEGGIYRGLRLDGQDQTPDDLDRKYLQFIGVDLPESNLMTTMKIRGLMDLIFGRVEYLSVGGLYDSLAIIFSEKSGLFIDFAWGGNRSVFQSLLLMTLAGFSMIP
jgi:hypothetical protein